ncbi:asparagine synthase-related protein [Lacinutrix gracilariae]|uniref:asparagine synthase (glutamine-hydrolyzing) n=1 Tax=Lacinutrix gracilariae TaxID=1747198 RepID=A0ABW5K314_9FLAO
MKIKTAIIPTKQSFAKVDAPHELHLEAICVFAAIGFFLDQDTYYKDEVVLAPSTKYELNEKGFVVNSEPWFHWHYTPRDITFNQALKEFSSLFETIMQEQTQGKKVILPLSGGLDSRSQAVALKQINADVFSYSYQYKNGFDETSIAKKIAEASHFDFKRFKISNAYLWGVIDDLLQLNKGYSDFTAPRQMAIFEEYAKMGDVFSLGHWGDVLFDSMNVSQLSKEEEVRVLQKKLCKRGGVDFANTLWNAWGLPGDFNTYFASRIEGLLGTIEIKDTNAKLRAFKSKYWAPRWTSINLAVFEKAKPITLPYYDERMCEFICTIPEEYLKNRQLQIAYIQSKAPELARIQWQDQRPFHLNNFRYNKIPYNLPYRIANKVKREIKAVSGKPYIQRNWELQFLGDANKQKLKEVLLDSDLKKWIPKSILANYYNSFFNTDHLQNAHAINILLVLAKFNQKYNG